MPRTTACHLSTAAFPLRGPSFAGLLQARWMRPGAVVEARMWSGDQWRPNVTLRGRLPSGEWEAAFSSRPNCIGVTTALLQEKDIRQPVPHVIYEEGRHADPATLPALVCDGTVWDSVRVPPEHWGKEGETLDAHTVSSVAVVGWTSSAKKRRQRHRRKGGATKKPGSVNQPPEDDDVTGKDKHHRHRIAGASKYRALTWCLFSYQVEPPSLPPLPPHRRRCRRRLSPAPAHAVLPAAAPPPYLRRPTW